MSRPSSDAIGLPRTRGAGLIERFLEARFPRSLLALADRTAPLIRHIDDCWLDTAYGLVFLGFATPVHVVVADDVDTGWVVLKDLYARRGGGTLVFHEADPIASRVHPDAVSWDPWMLVDLDPSIARTDPPRGLAQPLTDADELAAFLHGQGMSFWHRDMLEFGCAHGVRDGGELVATCALNFALASSRYAQIGGVCTRPSHRGQGLASECVRAALRDLGEKGIARAGLFADQGQPELLGFYRRLGFRERGRFGFVAVEDLLTSFA